MTGASSRSHGDDCASMLARYGELAAELEDETDPARCRALRQRLAELDTAIDAVLQRATHPSL
ncbi:hypothetical protein GIY23_05440 [Allosaccharopolyspora coralli]|uniref:Uncharacterized protein n=1 Tax=Allosaccharopolyspora coralli TaxID=2665642 RepID=A0A5Q3Q7B8_9PSEU|nr:hypothetical protein [Allosaccharopolyspora coralli]QGK69054.1 hypothetical protein GIY23_05440 [Allosaccharopolyspora coralli]